MTTRRNFTGKDIGAELLPILTSGIYSHPYDALREYIQNGIDALASSMTVFVSEDLVTVHDDGHGMTMDVARKAIRLGMSEKNPSKHVGFRGIGIYSAFNLCDTLEIFTKSDEDGRIRIVFDFGAVRQLLSRERKNRQDGEPSQLSLEELLEKNVYLHYAEESDEFPFEGAGTEVMLSGLADRFAKAFTEEAELISYLQDTVPLPFAEDFIHKAGIEAVFSAQEYKVVDLTLKSDLFDDHQLRRPYHNGMFTHGKGIGPEFQELKSNTLGRFGFAWYCHNDERAYLVDRRLRGLLVKKSGFSIGRRESFVTHFTRPVFNNRITGEIIITSDRLLPNAARSAFEASPERNELMLEFDQLASEIANWANKIQEEMKAEETLASVVRDSEGLLEEIATKRRDVRFLLHTNTIIAGLRRKLENYRAHLDRGFPAQRDEVMRTLDRAAEEIRNILQKGKKVESQRTAINAGRKAKEELQSLREQLRSQYDADSLIDLLAQFGYDLSDDLRKIVAYIDKNALRDSLSDAQYDDFLADLSIFIEEDLR